MPHPSPLGVSGWRQVGEKGSEKKPQAHIACFIFLVLLVACPRSLVTDSKPHCLSVQGCRDPGIVQRLYHVITDLMSTSPTPECTPQDGREPACLSYNLVLGMLSDL